MDKDLTVRIVYTPPATVRAEPIIFESTPEPGVSLLHGVRGLGIAPVEHTTAGRTQNHGSILRATRLKEREIFLPIIIDGTDVQDVDAIRDSLVDAATPLHGPGTLTITRIADGQTRTIGAIYKDGLSGDYGEGYYGTWHTFGLTFLAVDAFFSSETRTSQWGLKTTATPFISAQEKFFPVVLSKSSVNGSQTIDVEGAVAATPSWTVTGPVTDLTIKNRTTGEEFTFQGEIKAGETVTVDTSNNLLSGSSKSADQLWDSLTLESVLFLLQPGENILEVKGTSMTDQSSISIAYEEKHLTGY